MSAVCRNRKCGRPTGEFLCSDCTSVLADVLEGVPWLLEQLAVTALRLDRVNSGLRAGKRPDRPLPFNPEAAELHASLDNSITTWVRHLCESRGIGYVPVGYVAAAFMGPLPRGGRRVPVDYVETSAGTARWLLEHVDAVRLDEAGGDIFREITGLAEASLAAINPPPGLVFRGPCPTLLRTSKHGQAAECGTALYADRELQFIVCDRCNVRHDVSLLEQQLLARIGAQVFELGDLLRVLRELGNPIPRGTVASWISRGQLKAQQHNGGRPLYRVDDARRLRNLASHLKGSTA